MFIKQIYTNCLSHAAYYIESNGEAAIIDPLADIDMYIDLALQRDAKIKYIFETHFHADFVSGHLELANKTGAQIVFGDIAKPEYKVYSAKDNEVFKLGSVSLKALHTPGHTLESVTYLLLDEQNNEHAIFTGDTLFLGDVGRPDLASGNLSSQELASLLYDSLQTKIMSLPDSVLIYPGHGAGSACGKKLDDAKVSTLGEQKKSNYALKAKNKSDFIQQVTEGMKIPPAYFFSVAKLNKSGYKELSLSLPELNLMEFVSITENKNTIILDARSKEVFVKGFIPNSINIGLSGRFAPWVGAMIPPNSELVIITNKSQKEEVIIRLARVGYTNIKGVFIDGVQKWKEHGYKLDTIELKDISETNQMIDVRSTDEFEMSKKEDIKNIPIENIQSQIESLKDQDITLTCASGYRAIMAASLLKKDGVKKVSVSI